MSAIEKALVAERNATFRIGIRYRYPDGTSPDLTDGYGATFVVKKRNSDDPPLHSYAFSMSDDGWMRLVVTDEETLTWPAGPYAYTVALDFPNGEKDFLYAGPLSIRGY